MAADLSDPTIQQAFDEIKGSDKINWICLGYVPRNDTKLQVSGKGSGGLKEFNEELSAGKILFGLISFEVNKTKKFVYVAWCGEGVTGMKKGLFNNHSNDVARFFKGFHVQVNARNEDDVVESKIMERLKKATGASYDSGAKVQGTGTVNVPTNVREGRQLATASNASVKVADKSDYNKASESQSFWNKQKQEEEARKNNPKVADKSDYNKKEESAAYWQKQKEEEEERKRQEAAARQQQKPAVGGASSIRSQFENRAAAATTSAPPPSRPAPAKVAPVPVRQPDPEPEPEPEPVQETYDEPQQHYEEQQQYYEEPQQHYEEQQQYEEPQQQYEEQQYNDQQQYDQQQYDDQSQYQQQEYNDQQQQYDNQETYQETGSGYGVGQCRALYDFDGENPDDLPFKEGEVIIVLDKSDPSGWWQGELNGRVGFFPNNFVEEF